MKPFSYCAPCIPSGPNSIKKGSPLYNLLDETAIRHLARNIQIVYIRFRHDDFIQNALTGLETLGIMDRGRHIARSLFNTLNLDYDDAIAVMLESLTEPRNRTEDSGLATFFYLPHSFLISNYSPDIKSEKRTTSFPVAMEAIKQLTMRFTSEFCIRPFLITQQEETLGYLHKWVHDTNPHVRRLCSEGSRPRLPWGQRIPSFINDPSPSLPILEALKDDSCLYVRRSVANHLGDITKDHPNFVVDVCERWLKGASNERRWLIRHALRYPCKKGNIEAAQLRSRAKSSIA